MTVGSSTGTSAIAIVREVFVSAKCSFSDAARLAVTDRRIRDGTATLGNRCRLWIVPFMSGIVVVFAYSSRVSAQQAEPNSARAVARLSASPRLSAESLTTTFRTEIAAAEADGAKFPKPSNAKDAAPRRCVVPGRGATTSGDFKVTAFSQYPMIWHSGQGKLAWYPAQMDTSAALVVDARRLDKPQAGRTYRSTTIAQGSPSTAVLHPTLFYPTHIYLPSVGIWLLVAHAGANWGCFVFRLE
jgi:hypothetical protein